ncbi:MAG: ABC transporter substrate-binding protein, partial [Dehalococcoidia bacterium]|nr:ABC transporter substrate-binding protein [Dehalococcoidia bacterium]
MKRVLKGVIIPILACLVLLVTSSCGGAAENVVKIGVVGPMTFIQGEHHWYGATLAAEEINAAGGIMIGNEAYQIQLVKVDSNEILSPTDAASAMERVLTVDKVDFVVGGFRTEGVFPMQEIAMDNKTIFLGCGSATKALCDGVADDYDRYKYWFRVTPVNDVFLFSVDMELLKMVAEALRTECGIETPKVAILAEKLEWAETIVTFANALIPSAGMEVVGTWRPSD